MFLMFKEILGTKTEVKSRKNFPYGKHWNYVDESQWCTVVMENSSTVIVLPSLVEIRQLNQYNNNNRIIIIIIVNIIMSALQTVTKRHLRISIKLEMPDICQIYGGKFNKKNGHPLFVLTSRNAPVWERLQYYKLYPIYHSSV